MDEPPRRRRRPPPPKEPSGVPLLAIFAAVIVAGFAIGAVISLLQHRDAQLASSASSTEAKASAAPSAVLLPASTPTPEPTLAATAAPAETAAPTPSATRSPRATPVPTPAPGVEDTPSPRETAAPKDTPAPKDAPAPATASPVSSATAQPRVAVAPPKAAPPKAAPAQSSPAASADSEFARQSAAVVRAYLSALARGDDAAAQAALDAPSGSRAAQLSEKEFAGPDMRISSVEAHGTSESARVDVDVQTPKGAYFAQFFVKKSPGGSALIVNHDFIKP